MTDALRSHAIGRLALDEAEHRGPRQGVNIVMPPAKYGMDDYLLEELEKRLAPARNLMTEPDFRGPKPAAQWDSVPAPELARLRRIESAAEAVVTAYDDSEDGNEAKLDELGKAMDELRNAGAP
jgi:hypothetical protein